MKNSTRILGVSLFFLFTSFTLFAQKYSGSSWKEINSAGNGKLTCIYNETPGLVYNEGGKMKGVCVDILNDFKKFVQNKYGKTIEINFAGQESVFTDFLNEVKTTPNIIGVTNTTITTGRKKIFSFSPAYMTNPMVLLTNRKTPAISDLKEIAQKFNGYTAVVIEGSTHVNHIKKLKANHLPTLKIEYAPNGAAILDRIVKDDKSFTIIDFTEYFGSIKKRLPIQRHNVKLSESSEELGFVMQRGSDWEPLWNEFLTHDYRNSVQYKRIVSDNLGTSFLGLIR